MVNTGMYAGDAVPMAVEAQRYGDAAEAMNDAMNSDSFSSNGLVMARNMMALSRGSNMIIRSLDQFGIVNDENRKWFNICTSATMATVGAIGLYKAINVAIKIKRSREAALASADTTRNVIAQNWPGIATAAAAVGVFYGTFKAGQKFGSGEWSFNRDINTGTGRRGMEQDMRGSVYA